MNCFNHTDTTSVAMCQGCQKGLCTSCASAYNVPACQICHSNFRNESFKKVSNELLTVSVIAAATMFIIIKWVLQDPTLSPLEPDATPESQKLVLFFYAYASVAIVVGWKTLDKLTANYFLFLPIIGWLVYFIIKLQVSCFFGLFYTPIWLFRKIRKLYKIWKMGA